MSEKERNYFEESQVSHAQELETIKRREESETKRHEHEMARMAKEFEYSTLRDKVRLEQMCKGQEMLAIVAQMVSTLQTNAYTHEERMLTIKCGLLKELKPSGLSVHLNV